MGSCCTTNMRPWDFAVWPLGKPDPKRDQQCCPRSGRVGGHSVTKESILWSLKRAAPSLGAWAEPSVLFNTWGAGTEKISLPIKLYDFATHSVTPLGVIDKEVDRNFSGFSITNDGRRIAWAQIDHAETDLMMIENFR